jgi:hypothetical protein
MHACRRRGRNLKLLEAELTALVAHGAVVGDYGEIGRRDVDPRRKVLPRPHRRRRMRVEMPFKTGAPPTAEAVYRQPGSYLTDGLQRVQSLCPSPSIFCMAKIFFSASRSAAPLPLLRRQGNKIQARCHRSGSEFG